MSTSRGGQQPSSLLVLCTLLPLLGMLLQHAAADMRLPARRLLQSKPPRPPPSAHAPIPSLVDTQNNPVDTSVYPANMSAALLVEFWLFGTSLLPFESQDRNILATVLNQTLTLALNHNISITSVTEFYALSPPPLAVRPPGPPASAPAQSIPQPLAGNLDPTVALVPRAQITILIGTTAGQARDLEVQLVDTVYGDLLARLQAAGLPAQDITLQAVELQQALPGSASAPAPASTSPPSLLVGRAPALPTTPAAPLKNNVHPATADAELGPTGLGLIIGIGVPALLAIVVVAYYLITRKCCSRRGLNGTKTSQGKGSDGTLSPAASVTSLSGAQGPPGGLKPLDIQLAAVQLPPRPQLGRCSAPLPAGHALGPYAADAATRGSLAFQLHQESSSFLLRGTASLDGGVAPWFKEDPTLEDTNIEGAVMASAAAGGEAAGLHGTEAWTLAFQELELNRQIGEGSFGQVYLGRWRETTVAIKLLSHPAVFSNQSFPYESDGSGSGGARGMSVSGRNRVLLGELQREAGIVASLRHPNVVMFLGVCLEPPCMVTEFCARGSLLDVLRHAQASQVAAAQLDWARRLAMALDAAKGMLYLHTRQPPIVHRDLKTANLLVDKHWKVKVADFNLSRVMHTSAMVSSVAATNPRWLAPEVLAGSTYNTAADVYSFGIILWELLTWRIPWEDLGPWQVVIAVVEQRQRPELPVESSLPGISGIMDLRGYLALMGDCWADCPEARLPFDAVITRLRALLEAQQAADLAGTSGSSAEAGFASAPAAGRDAGEASSSSAQYAAEDSLPAASSRAAEPAHVVAAAANGGRSEVVPFVPGSSSEWERRAVSHTVDCRQTEGQSSPGQW